MNERARMEPPLALQSYTREIVVGGKLRLHYYEVGAHDAPPLLLIHGLGDEADTWRHVVLPLAERWRVVAPDLPGFGRSERPWRAYTSAFFAQSIAQLLAALAIPQASLVGSSLGAAVALRLALGRSALVERLVLIGGGLPLRSGLPPAPLWSFLAPGVGELVYTVLRLSQDKAYATLRPFYYDLDGLPGDDRTFLRTRVWARVWHSGQRRAFLSALRWLTIERTFCAPILRGQVARLRVPTLLIWGAHDLVAPRALGDELAALLPQARLEIIPKSGHLPQQEQPDALIACINEEGHRRV